MSCNCEQTNTINCTTCNNACNECSCPVETTFMPETTTCSEPSECSEIYPAQCVIYEGPTLQCSLESVNNYPAVIHTLANNNDNITTIFENINSQLCYLFSKDYIKTMLSIINSTNDLKTLFCSITCNTSCTLSCPSITFLVYNYNNSTLTVTFNAITGAPTNIAYRARAYKKNTNGTYNAVNAFSTQASTQSSITSMTINLINLTGTLSTDEWLVSVKVYENGNENGCYTGIDYGGSATNIVYNPEQCGTAITQPVVLTCCTSCLCLPDSPSLFNLNNNVLTFNFTYLSLTTFNTNNYYAPTFYTFHWYKKTTSGTQFANNIYTYVNSSTYTQGVTSPTTGTITNSYVNGEEYVLLLLVTTSNVNCYNGLPVRSTSPNNTYTGAEIAKINCNKYMFPNT